MGSVNEYDESLEFWECSAFRLRLTLPSQFFENEIDELAWFWRAWSMLVEL